jgi:hypothetical protein
VSAAARSRGAPSVRAWLVGLLLAVGLSGCCTTTEETVVFERTRDDEGRSCEEICDDTIVPESEETTYELVGCDEGLSENNLPAVFCRFESTYCETELH